MYSGYGNITCDSCGTNVAQKDFTIVKDKEGIKHFCDSNCQKSHNQPKAEFLNILLAFSSHDGANCKIFSTKSIDPELKHHRDLMDAINFARNNKNGQGNFGDHIEVIWGEICQNGYHIENLLDGAAQFSDEDSEEYDKRYSKISINPPVHIDEVYTVKTFL